MVQGMTCVTEGRLREGTPTTSIVRIPVNTQAFPPCGTVAHMTAAYQISPAERTGGVFFSCPRARSLQSAQVSSRHMKQAKRCA